MGRDARWEKVWARHGTPEIHPSDVENGFAETLEKQLEFRIEVVYNGTLWHCVQRVQKDEWEDLRNEPGVFAFIMSEMIGFMDDLLDGRRNLEGALA